MYKISFDLETITPLFMAGADGITPELRPPSFKGMIRFWWRAMRAEDDIQALVEEEAILFGGTGKGQGKSKLTLRTFSESSGIRNNLKNDENTDDYPGIGYLLYSTFMQRGKERFYFKPKLPFKLVMLSKDKKLLSQAQAAFWLAVNFGGFGTRSRRGGGNLAVIDLQGSLPKLEDIKKIFVAEQNVQSFIKAGFTWTKNIIQQNQTVKFSNLSEPRILLGINHSETNWKEALNNIGTLYKKYRTDMKGELFNGPHFGMPVMHNRFKTRLVGYQNDKLLSDRRGSPLIIKLLKFNDKYVPSVIKMAGNLLPNSSVIMKEYRSGRNWMTSGESQKEDSKVLDNFLDELISEGFTEVTL